MCLTTDQSKPLIADKEIICYKEVESLIGESFIGMHRYSFLPIYKVGETVYPYKLRKRIYLLIYRDKYTFGLDFWNEINKAFIKIQESIFFKLYYILKFKYLSKKYYVKLNSIGGSFLYGGYNQIDHGLHSYGQFNWDNSYMTNMSRSKKIIQCTIPIGAEYAISVYNDEYVSNKLRIDKILTYDDMSKLIEENEKK